MSELFTHQTVKSVAFEIKFSNIFFIENKIGDFQFKIMREFPESEEVIQRQFIISQSENYKKPEEIEPDAPTRKIWKFISPKGYNLNLSTNSLSITSSVHKTYNNPKGEFKFRDIIVLALDSFLEILPNSIEIKRMGLRYIDECPLPKTLNNENYKKLYNTTFDLGRFKIENTPSQQYIVQHKLENGIVIRYMEFKNEEFVKLDFDASATNVELSDYLLTTDNLYQAVHQEWEKTITEDFKQYMRTGELPC